MSHQSETTINAYNKSAEKYADKFMDFKAYKDKIKQFQKKYINSGARILDAGCGPGNNAKLLLAADSGLSITGVDLSEEMIRLARKNAPGADFFVKDLQELNIDQKYDSVIASFCIVHLSDEQTGRLIETINDLLNDDGSLYISFMEGKSSGFETTGFSDIPLFFNYYDRNYILQLLIKNGMELVEVHDEDYEEPDGSLTKDIFIFAKKKIL